MNHTAPEGFLRGAYDRQVVVDASLGLFEVRIAGEAFEEGTISD